MLPTSERAVLKTPANWELIHGEALVEQLVDQIDSRRLRVSAYRALIWTYFDLLIRTRWRNDPPIITERPRLAWRVNDGRFYFFPELSIDIFFDDAPWRKDKKRGRRVHLLAPCRQTWILQCALKHDDGSNDAYMVQSVSELLGNRMCWMSGDTDWSQSRIKWEFLTAFNSRLTQSGVSRRLRVEIPDKPM